MPALDASAISAAPAHLDLSPDSLTRATLAELGQALRAGAVSAVDLLDAHLARVERVNPLLNAMVVARYAEARVEAEAADARLAAGQGVDHPLLGIPCSLKEMLAFTGLPQTAGIPRRRDTIATEDAAVVARIREAGAVVMGLTNVPEGGMWMETANGVYGRTANPWDVRRTSGGSSGGEAALVASGAAVFGIGSDVGGSIRIPGAFCGVPGHKPSGGLVPNTGHWPGNPGIGGYLCIGPFARNVSDLFTVLQVIAGPDAGDPASDVGRTLRDPATVDVRRLKVFPVLGDGRMKIDAPVKAALNRSAAALQAEGCQVGEIDPRRFRGAFRIWSSMLAECGNHPQTVLLGDGRRVRPVVELMRLAMGRSEHTFPALVLAAVEPFGQYLPGGAKKAVAQGLALRDELEGILGDDGVLLYPPYTGIALPHRRPLLRPFDAMCTGLFNVLEFPGTVVPTGLTAEGMPTAVQILAARGQDHLTLAVAGALERSLGGWQRAEPRPAARPPRLLVGARAAR